MTFMTYASTLFATCPVCFHPFGRVYDKDSAASKDVAQARLNEDVENCNHVGGPSL